LRLVAVADVPLSNYLLTMCEEGVYRTEIPLQMHSEFLQREAKSLQSVYVHTGMYHLTFSALKISS